LKLILCSDINVENPLQLFHSINISIQRLTTPFVCFKKDKA